MHPITERIVTVRYQMLKMIFLLWKCSAWIFGYDL